MHMALSQNHSLSPSSCPCPEGVSPFEGATRPVRYAIASGPFGVTLVALGPNGLSALLLGSSEYEAVRDLRRLYPRAYEDRHSSDLKQLQEEARLFLENPRNGWDPLLSDEGTPFQKKVWETLRGIPYGSTVSYAKVAEKLGCPKATRAVAQACSANRWAVLIPCHRVIRKDGDLGGFHWGLSTKQSLLDHEQATVGEPQHSAVGSEDR